LGTCLGECPPAPTLSREQILVSRTDPVNRERQTVVSPAEHVELRHELLVEDGDLRRSG
jgi:hypothetical protein